MNIFEIFFKNKIKDNECLLKSIDSENFEKRFDAAYEGYIRSCAKRAFLENSEEMKKYLIAAGVNPDAPGLLKEHKP